MNRVQLINHLKGVRDLMSQETQLAQVYNKVVGEQKGAKNKLSANRANIIRENIGITKHAGDIFYWIFFIICIGLFIAFPFILHYLHKTQEYWFPFMKDSRLLHLPFIFWLFRLFRNLVLWILFGLALILCDFIYYLCSFPADDHPALEKQCNLLNLVLFLFPICYFLLHRFTSIRIPIAIDQPWYIQILKGFIVWTLFGIIYHVIVILTPFGKTLKTDEEKNKKILDAEKQKSDAYYHDALGKIEQKYEEVKRQKEQALRMKDSSGNQILNSHYWDLTAISMFIQYLEHELCYQLGGPGGAYALYEQELERERQSQQMDAYRRAVEEYTQAINQNAQAMGQKLDNLIATSNEIKATEEVNMWFNAFNTAYTREILKKMD